MYIQFNQYSFKCFILLNFARQEKRFKLIAIFWAKVLYYLLCPDI